MNNIRSTKFAVMEGIRDVKVLERTLPELKPDEVLIRMGHVIYALLIMDSGQEPGRTFYSPWPGDMSSQVRSWRWAQK